MKEERSSPRIADIRERAFDFAVRVIKLSKLLERNSGVSRSLLGQLMRSATSIGANLEEAQAAQSRPDFIHKNSVSLKEAREANYWLRLIAATEQLDGTIAVETISLRDESLEIAKIIGKIIVSSKRS